MPELPEMLVFVLDGPLPKGKMAACSRKGCAEETATPDKEGWRYCEAAGRKQRHWIGKWMCPSCFASLSQMLGQTGTRPVAEH